MEVRRYEPESPPEAQTAVPTAAVRYRPRQRWRDRRACLSFRPSSRLFAYGARVGNRRQTEMEVALGPARPPKSTEVLRRGFAPAKNQAGYDTGTTEDQSGNSRSKRRTKSVAVTLPAWERGREPERGLVYARLAPRSSSSRQALSSRSRFLPFSPTRRLPLQAGIQASPRRRTTPDPRA